MRQTLPQLVVVIAPSPTTTPTSTHSQLRIQQTIHQHTRLAIANPIPRTLHHAPAAHPRARQQVQIPLERRHRRKTLQRRNLHRQPVHCTVAVREPALKNLHYPTHLRMLHARQTQFLIRLLRLALHITQQITQLRTRRALLDVRLQAILQPHPLLRQSLCPHIQRPQFVHFPQRTVVNQRIPTKPMPRQRRPQRIT